MSATVVDRRVRRSRAALQRALVDLVLEKGYDAVSVDAVAERADVTRATFYAHYLNKEHLLTAVVDDFADAVLAAFEEHESASRSAGRLALLLEQAGAQREVLRIIVRGEGNGAPLRRFTERIEQVVRADVERRVETSGARVAVPVELVAKLRAASVVAAVAWFIDHDDTDPVDLAEGVLQTLERGLTWALGVAPA